MGNDVIARAAAVITRWTNQQAAKSGKTWGPWPAAEALAAAGLLASVPDPTTAKLIEAAIAWYVMDEDGTDALDAAAGAYLAAHPEVVS